MTPPLRDADSGTGQAFQALACAAVAVMLLSPFGALQPFEWGAWRLTAVSIWMMHLGGALACGGLVLALARGGPGLAFRSLRGPGFALFCGGLALAAGGLPGAVSAEFPLLAVAGTYQSGQGLLWFMHFAVAALLFSVLVGIDTWRRLLDWGLLAALGGLTLGRIVDMLMPETVLFLPGGDSYAYLAAAGIAVSLTGRGLAGQLNCAILGISIVLMAVSGNLAAIAISAGLALMLTLFRLSPSVAHGMRFFANPLAATGLLASTILAPVALLFAMPSDFVPASLQSRVLIHELSWAVLQDSSLAQLALGRGWGHVQAAYYSNFLAADYPVYRQEWDFVWRDIFHSHNAAVETLLSAGVLGLTVHVIVFVTAIRYAARAQRGALWFLLLFYLAMGGLWFEFSFALPFLALAAVCCIVPDRPGSDQPEPAQKTIPAGRRVACMAAMAAMAVLFAVTFTRLAAFDIAVTAHKYDQIAETPEHALRFDAFPRDPRGSYFVESILMREIWRKRERLRDSRDWQDDALLARALLERTETVRSSTAAAPMLLVGLSVLNDLAFYQGAAMQQIAVENVNLWRALVERHWALEPKRTDVSVGYFELLKQAGAFDRLAAETAQRLQQNPDDPVAVYYAALASLHKVPAERNRDAMRSILRAIDLGLDLILPIDPQFEADLRRDYGDGAAGGTAAPVPQD
ncbi:hypothetical protein [Pacificispira sp.]|uniref:hypothetical protein n=1 Tax=Pacificispira sp. TaxID=2888761 RepID=UPI003BAC2899